MTFHKPILLKETIEGLNIVPDGVYVDMTFGGGGHSKEILKRLGSGGKLLAFDQDEDAWKNAIEDSRFQLFRSNFKYASRFVRLSGVGGVDGVLADIGVSSHQFDQAERGFSYRFEGDLDMRMNRKQGLSARQVLNDYDEKELLRVFSSYGEIRNSKQLARKIVEQRSQLKIKTSGELESAIEGVIRGDRIRYLAQLYQAIRIEVNDELGALKEMLERSVEMLNVKGRIVVITFHSIEDRIVKRFFKTGNVDGKVEKDAFGVVQKSLREVVKGVILPGEEEMIMNPRSKSAKLRIAEKI